MHCSLDARESPTTVSRCATIAS